MGCTKESRVPFRGTRLSFVRPAAGPVARRSAAAKIRIYPDRRSRPDKKSDAPRSAAQPPAHRHKSPTRIRLLPGTGTNRTADPTADPDTRASGHRGTGTGTKKTGRTLFKVRPVRLSARGRTAVTSCRPCRLRALRVRPAVPISSRPARTPSSGTSRRSTRRSPAQHATPSSGR